MYVANDFADKCMNRSIVDEEAASVPLHYTTLGSSSEKFAKNNISLEDLLPFLVVKASRLHENKLAIEPCLHRFTSVQLDTINGTIDITKTDF